MSIDNNVNFNYVLTNINTINSINDNDKLFIWNNTVKIHHPYLFRWVDRKLSNQNSEITYKYVNNLVTITLNDINNYDNDEKLKCKFIKNVNEYNKIKNQLIKLDTSLNKLKVSYNDESIFCLKIDTLLNRIENLNKINMDKKGYLFTIFENKVY